MKKIVKSRSVPAGSVIAENFPAIDFCDSYRIDPQPGHSPDQLVNRLFRLPGWVSGLLKLRNRLVRIVGLKGADKKESDVADFYPVGTTAGYFTVLDRNDREIVIGENDKHLDFRVSLLHTPDGIYCTTIVHYHNRLGRVYFFFIRPFHSIIVRSLVRRNLSQI